MTLRNPISLLLLISCMCLGAHAQVDFQSLPRSKQLYPRDLTTNMATVAIEGDVTWAGSPYSAIEVTVLGLHGELLVEVCDLVAVLRRRHSERQWAHIAHFVTPTIHVSPPVAGGPPRFPGNAGRV